jgi:hypothetical protein
MADQSREQGQAMVEMAFLLPLILLVLASMLQILLVADLHMKLQHSAARAAKQLACGQSRLAIEGALMLDYRRSIQGTLPIARLDTPDLRYWRKYCGENTATEHNCMAVADLSCPLFGNWFARVGLKPIALRAHAELPCEPRDIGEPS